MPHSIRPLFTLALLAALLGFSLQRRAYATAPGVACDYNNNGICDAADYVLWRNGGPLQNEGDNPGVVNQADYEFWRARFGNTSGSGAAVVITPEPSTLLLTIAAMAGLGGRRRNRPTLQGG